VDEQANVLFISAPVTALVEGIYQADTTRAQIRRHGDLALGTFDQLDGELVMLDGRAYRVAGDGSVQAVADTVRSPFVVATRFCELSQDELLDGCTDQQDLLAPLGQLLPSPNMMYALRVEATFAWVRTRSVPRQERYRPLVEVTRAQPTFERHQVAGTRVGFYTPAFMASLNVPGFHLHFLSDDVTFGGHLLQCRASRARVRLQVLRHLCMDLPSSLAYLTTDFVRPTAADLAQAEVEAAPAGPRVGTPATAPA
jgi:acetolactate decarboxylase